MGEREERRARSARRAKIEEAPPAPAPVVVVAMWECAGCHVRVPRGESCSRCSKRLLEG